MPKWGCDGIGIPAETKKKFSFTKSIVGNTVGFALSRPVGGLQELRQALKEKTKKIRLFKMRKCF